MGAFGAMPAGDDSLPDFFCEDYLTFRTSATTGVQKEDDQIVADLLTIQPTPPLDTRATISPEAITGAVTTLRR